MSESRTLAREGRIGAGEWGGKVDSTVKAGRFQERE